MASVDPARRGAGAFYVASGAGRNNVAASGLTLLRGCGAPHSNPGLDMLTLPWEAEECSKGEGPMTAIGRGWEALKAVGVVLWPIRFILLVMVAMIGILA